MPFKDRRRRLPLYARVHATVRGKKHSRAIRFLVGEMGHPRLTHISRKSRERRCISISLFAHSLILFSQSQHCSLFLLFFFLPSLIFLFLSHADRNVNLERARASLKFSRRIHSVYHSINYARTPARYMAAERMYKYKLAILVKPNALVTHECSGEVAAVQQYSEQELWCSCIKSRGRLNEKKDRRVEPVTASKIMKAIRPKAEVESRPRCN